MVHRHYTDPTLPSTIGQVQSFMTHDPPWALGTPTERETQVAQLAWVKWFGYRGRNQNVYTALVYTRAFVPQVDGDIGHARC